MDNDIEGFFNKEEGEIIYSAVKSTKDMTGEVIEIGSYYGKSTFWLASAVKEDNRKMVCIDHFLGSQEHQKALGGKTTFDTYIANMKRYDLYENIIIIASSSSKATQIWDKPIKFLFIDADHDYEGVKRDFDFYEKFVVPGGLIALHDVHPTWPGPERLFNEIIKQKDKYQLYGRNDMSLRIIRKVK